MKRLTIIILLAIAMALIFWQPSHLKDYNKQVCAVYGYEADCTTKLAH